MATANEEIYRSLVNHGILVQRYSNSEVEKIIRMMNNEVLPQIQMEIIPLANLGTGEEAIERQAKIMSGSAGKAMDNVMDTLQDDMGVFATAEAEFTKNAVNQNLPEAVAFSFSKASPEMLRELAFNTPFQGEILSGWARDLNESMQENILRELRVGMVQGESIPALTERIIGTEQMAFGDGVWETQLRHAESVTRTAVNHVNTSARRSVYKENEEYLQGLQFLATLDSHTTLVCAEKDNNIYPVDEFPYPPLHFNCRSTSVPVLKATTKSTRASIGGPVSEDIDYEQWLKDNPAKQEKVLGKTKAKMFRDGKITLSDAVKDKTNTLTLAQIMTKEGISPERYASGGLLTRLKKEISTLGG